MESASKKTSIFLVSDFCTTRALEEAGVDGSQGVRQGSYAHSELVPELPRLIERNPKSVCVPSKRKRLADDGKVAKSLLNANVLSKRMHLDADASSFKFCRTLWMGVKHTSSEKTMDGHSQLSLQELMRRYRHLKLVEWDGKKSIKIADKDGRIIAHLGGKPKQKSFMRSIKRLEIQMRNVRIASNIPAKVNRGQEGIRGDHSSATCGYTYPGGKPHPSVLRNDSVKGHEAALSLSLSKDAKRVKGIQAGMLKSAAPRMYDLYCETDRIVRENSPGLEDDLRRFSSHEDPPGEYPFASVTYNFGEQTVCRRHRDCMNFAPGWCAITSLGNYNPRSGGHIVLWELGLIIEFPPGATILIPSAILTHFNTAISPSETRMSVVRYSAGGLFLWSARFRSSNSAASRERNAGINNLLFTEPLQLYMTLDELTEQCEHFVT